MAVVEVRRSTADPVAVDTANIGIQGRVVSKTLNYTLFTMNRNAVWAGRQQLQKESYPLAVISFPANRKIFRYEVGDVFKYRYSKYNVVDMICRVMQKEEEAIGSERITVYVIEDPFAAVKRINEYLEPGSLQIPGADYSLLPFFHQMIMEAPFALSEVMRVLTAACRESDRDIGFAVYMSIDGGASYTLVDSVPNIVPYGTLVGTYPKTYTIDEKVGFIIEFHNMDVANIETVTWSEVFAAEKNTGLLGNEIISFHSITPVSGMQYKLEGIIRGRFDTVKEEHAAGTELYVIMSNVTLVGHKEILPGVTRQFKYVPFNRKKLGDISQSIPLTLNIIGRSRTPYIPFNFFANDGQFAARYDTDIVLTWSPRNRGKGAGIGAPGIVLPSVEREGLFEIEVWVGGVKVRTTTAIDATTWTYTEAMNIADNGSLVAIVVFKISNYRDEGGITYESVQAQVTCKKN